jgi:hemerythrin-like domain-containing protein
MPLSAKPLQPDSFLDPLHIILTEHDRQRRVAEWLWTHSADQRLAPIQEQVATLLAYLTRDLLLHHRDEEDDLFPVLRARCVPTDGIETILAELDRDHAAESFLVRDIAVDLRVVAESRDLESPARFFTGLRIFAEGQRRHLSWENRVVMPLAGKRLTRQDLETLGRNMAARRDMDYGHT